MRIHIEVHHLDGESPHGTLTDVEVLQEDWAACKTESARKTLLFETIDAPDVCSGPGAIVQYTLVSEYYPPSYP